MNLKCCWATLFFSYCLLDLNAQQDSVHIFQTMAGDQLVTVHINNGDTLIEAELGVAYSFPLRFYENTADQERYLKYRRYAMKVYPYAIHAVRLYYQMLKATEGMSEKERKNFIKQIDQNLEEEFEEPLKNLTRTQGLILTKMMEKELDRSFYDLIHELKGGFAAFYWNQLGKFNGYKLKNKYQSGEDEILDTVLEEFSMDADLQDLK